MKLKSIKSISFLGVTLLILIVFWLPLINQPIDYDMLHYATLTENLILGKGYTEFGVPHSKYIIGHSIIAIPFVLLFGKNLGYKILGLFWGYIFFSS